MGDMLGKVFMFAFFWIGRYAYPKHQRTQFMKKHKKSAILSTMGWGGVILLWMYEIHPSMILNARFYVAILVGMQLLLLHILCWREEKKSRLCKQQEPPFTKEKGDKKPQPKQKEEHWERFEQGFQKRKAKREEKKKYEEQGKMEEILEQWLAILDLPSSERNFSAVRKQYVRLVKTYHPDVYAGKDGTEKTNQVVAAYRNLEKLMAN